MHKYNGGLISPWSTHIPGSLEPEVATSRNMKCATHSEICAPLLSREETRSRPSSDGQLHGPTRMRRGKSGAYPPGSGMHTASYTHGGGCGNYLAERHPPGGIGAAAPRDSR